VPAQTAVPLLLGPYLAGKIGRPAAPIPAQSVRRLTVT